MDAAVDLRHPYWMRLLDGNPSAGQPRKRARYCIPTALKYMGVNLRGGNITVPQLILYRANARAALQQMSGK